MEEKRPGLQKALRVLSVLLLSGSVLSFLVVVFTFVVAFFVDGQILTDGTGMMRLFLNAAAAGERSIDAGQFACAGMPALSAIVLLTAYSCVLVSYLFRRKKQGAAFSGAKGRLIALCVLAGLSIILPLVLWRFFAPIVAESGFFTLRMPSPIPGCVLLILTITATILALQKPKDAATIQQQEGDV